VTEAADATDLTRAEELRLRYAAIVESSDDAIIAKTLDGVISAWNAAAERMFGYEQILGAAIELMASDAASVQVLAPDHTSLTLLACRNFHRNSAAFWQRVAVGARSTCSKALRDNERVLVADIEACEFMAGTQDQQEYRRSGRSTSSTRTKRSAAEICTGRPSSSVSLFRWSIGSVATTANIAGW
jgi:PAS fold